MWKRASSCQGIVFISTTLYLLYNARVAIDAVIRQEYWRNEKSQVVGLVKPIEQLRTIQNSPLFIAFHIPTKALTATRD